jgi:hypothetical protein
MSLSIRVTYHSGENSLGQSRLWFASNTKQDFRKTFQRHKIQPIEVIKFEVKEDGIYVDKPIETLRGIVEEGGR